MPTRCERFSELDRAIADGRGNAPSTPVRGPVRPPLVTPRTRIVKRNTRLMMNEHAMRERQSRRTDPRTPKFERTLAEVCKIHELSQDVVLDGRQSADVVAARVELTHRLRRLGFSFYHMAKLTGFHHTTLMNHMRHEAPDFGEISVPDWSGEWAI
jgi:hypothetical protein